MTAALSIIAVLTFFDKEGKHLRQMRMTERFSNLIFNSKDFIVKTENIGRKKQGKREYLNNQLTRDLIKKIDFSGIFIPGGQCLD